MTLNTVHAEIEIWNVSEMPLKEYQWHALPAVIVDPVRDCQSR